MTFSEIMTIIILFQFSHYRTFKDFYLHCILIQYRREFPNCVSYHRFIELMPLVLMPLACMLTSLQGEETGSYFIDSTKLVVCHNLRINRHKTFKNFAKRGKTSTGWFYGFKLHLVFNNKGQIMRLMFTPGNTSDLSPVQQMMNKLKGWLVGDRGYISKKLQQQLQLQGIELITKLKKNMKKYILDPVKEFIVNKRNFVETAIGQLKNLLHIDHTRHRSAVLNFQVNVFAALVAYAFKPKKPNSKFANLDGKTLFLMSN